MKKFIGLVVILAALVLGGYYGMGVATEHTLKKNIGVVNQSNGVLVEIRQYDRGWFRSKAMLNWRFHMPARVVKNQDGQAITLPSQDYNVEMPLAIYHGPIIFMGPHVRFGLGYAYSDLTIPEQYVQKFSSMFGDGSSKPILKLSIFVNYLNNSRLHLDLPAFKLVSKQGGGTFQWEGMSSDVSASSDLRNIDGSVIIDGASLVKNNMKATLGKINSQYDLHRTDNGLYLGNASVGLPSLDVMENEKNTLNVEQLNLQSSSHVDNDLFSSRFKASLLKVTALDKSFGPAELSVAIKNLDADTLARINQQANKLQQGTDSDRQQALFAMLPELPKLFGKGAQFEISKLSFVMPDGNVEGELFISLPKGDVGNPFQLLKKVEGHGKLKLPATVLKGIVKASIKQKLLSQPSLPQAMAQQMQNGAPANSTEAKPAEVTSPAQAKQAPANTTAGDAVTTSGNSQVPSAPTAAVDVDAQAATEADAKLAALVKSGLFVLNGTDYVIDLNLADGQLTVNGNPFTPGMMQFQ